MAHHVAEGPPTPVSEFRPETEFKLCQACSRLDLRTQDFHVTQINDTGHDHDLPVPLRLFRGSSQRLATRCQIMANQKTCPLCSLIVRSLPMTSANDTISDDTMLSVKWEIDGRRENISDGQAKSNSYRGDGSASGRLKPLTRRLRLTWESPRPDDIYLLRVAPNTYHRANHDLVGNWDSKALFLGREIDPTKSNEVLLRSWLRACRTHHDSQCSPTREEATKMLRVAESSWFAVIDVFDMCLKPLPRWGSYGHEPYAILSYVWGPTSNYTTRKDNVLFHQSPGALEDVWSKLPKTVQNAIGLTKTLGLRYVWVDRLCIIQDSPRSCRLNINEMDTIYSNALFTICAADGADSQAGLKALLKDERSQTNQLIQKCGRVELIATQLTECAIKNSVWNTRAWTFQERMLSKRSFVFCRGRVYFQCRQSTMCEDIVAEPQGGGWSLELAQSPHQILHHLQKRPIMLYMECVSLYSKRQLSNSEDILSAFNGIGNILYRAMNAPLVWGLPTSHFDLALLWQPTKVVKRRTSGQGPNNTVLPFPSWAWCGWQPLDGGRDTEIKYCSSMLEGCLDSMRGFLRNRTWIGYYVRDDQGELRPIWDFSPDPAETEKRWRGYGSEPLKNWAPRTDNHRMQQYANVGTAMTRHLGPATHHPRTELAPYPVEGTQPYREGLYREEEYCRAGERPSIDIRVEHKTFHDGREYEERNRRVEDARSETSEVPRSMLQGSLAKDENGEWNADGYPMDDQADSYAPNQPNRVLFQYQAGQQFNRIYADSPYRVRMADPSRKPSPENPDQTVLQFWTRSCRLYLQASEPRSDNVTKLQRFDVLDLAGDWCGSILLDPDCKLLRDHEEMNDFGEPRRYEFLALSEAKSFTSEECKTWTYYSPSNQEQSEWELYHCLLVEEEEQVMYRVGLGKVFKSAFRGSRGDNWKEVILG